MQPPSQPEPSLSLTQRVLTHWSPMGWRGGHGTSGEGLIRAAHRPVFRLTLFVTFTVMVAGTMTEIDGLGTVAPGTLWEPLVPVIGLALCLWLTRKPSPRRQDAALIAAVLVGAWTISRHAARSQTPELHLLAPLFLLLALGLFLAPTQRQSYIVLAAGAGLPILLDLLDLGVALTVGMLPLYLGGIFLCWLLLTLLDGLHGALSLYVDEVNHLSWFDPLTGVLARRPFLELAGLRLDEARAVGQAVSLIYLDVDHFKRINDTFGHAAGDRVLVAVGQTLRALAEERLLAGRLGGEEFALLLLGEANEARGWADAARERIREECDVTVSVGVANGGELDELLRRADGAMYRAKQSGRNRVFSDVPLAVPPATPPPSHAPAARRAE